VKSRTPRRRKPALPRDILPPAVPEVVTEAAPATDEGSELLPDDIRRMLEAAYT
jgi:hypothetical protein